MLWSLLTGAFSKGQTIWMQTLTLQDSWRMSDHPLQPKAVILSQGNLALLARSGWICGWHTRGCSVLKEPGCCSRSPQYRVYPTRAVLFSMPMGQSPALGVITTTKDTENIWKVRLKGNILVPCNKRQTCSGSNNFQMAPDLFFHPIYNTKKSHIENKAPRCLRLLVGTISFKKKIRGLGI